MFLCASYILKTALCVSNTPIYCRGAILAVRSIFLCAYDNRLGTCA